MTRRGLNVFFVGLFIALTVLGIVLFSLGSTLDPRFRTFFQALPGFGQDAPPEGEAIIGLDLSKPDTPLVYYTGTKWKAAPPELFTLDGKTIKVPETQRALRSFYFDTVRDGGPDFDYHFYHISMNPHLLRYVQRENVPSRKEPTRDGMTQIVPGHKVSVHDEAYYSSFSLRYRPPYFAPSSNHQSKSFYLSVSKDTLFEAQSSVDSSPDYFVSVLSIKQFVPDTFFSAQDVAFARMLHLRWRDQILAGGECEKHVSLIGKPYSASKIDSILFVDLNSEALDKELYAPGCFRYASPESTRFLEGDSFEWARDYGLEFQFSFKNRLERYVWRGTSWNYYGDSADLKGIFDFRDSARTEFTLGLSLVVDALIEDYAFFGRTSPASVKAFVRTFSDARVLREISLASFLDSKGRIRKGARDSMLTLVSDEFNQAITLPRYSLMFRQDLRSDRFSSEGQFFYGVQPLLIFYNAPLVSAGYYSSQGVLHTQYVGEVKEGIIVFEKERIEEFRSSSRESAVTLAHLSSLDGTSFDDVEVSLR